LTLAKSQKLLERSTILTGIFIANSVVASLTVAPFSVNMFVAKNGKIYLNKTKLPE